MRFPSQHQWRRAFRLAVFCCIMWSGPIDVEAGSLYIYTDAQGQAVLTDNLQQVPMEFRGRLRTVSDGRSPSGEALTQAQEPTTSSRPSSSHVIQAMLQLVQQKVPPIKGLTGHQTAVVIVAGACLLALLCILFFTSNPAVRILAKCLIMLVGLAALYQLTLGGAVPAGPLSGSSPQATGVAEDNIMRRVQTMTQQNYRLQDERTTHQLEQAEPSTP